MPVALLGATLGGIAAFLVARRLGRGPAERWPVRGSRGCGSGSSSGRCSPLLARLAPGSPATIVNYAAGLTHIRLRHPSQGA